MNILAAVLTFLGMEFVAFISSLFYYTATQSGAQRLQLAAFLASLGCMALCVPVSLVVLFITGV